MYTVQTIAPAQLQSFYADFVGEKTFLQSSKYGIFRSNLGEKNISCGIFQSKKLIGVAQIQKINARRGTYLHIPHGPLIQKEHAQKALGEFLEYYKKYGQKENCDFVRLAPLLSPENSSFLEDAGFRPAPVHLVNPELTWVLDITPTEDELLKNMKKSTRYEIRRIEKSGITTHQGNKTHDLNLFWSLHTETVRRHGFVPFSRTSTEKELRTFGDDVQIFSAEKDGSFFSSSIIIFDDRAGYYHQGASLPHKLPFSYATLWAAIREAKRRGCSEFNFWGVCEADQKKHPWFGLSRFKRKFGGEERRYVHVHDFAITPKYWFNWGIEKYRKWKRGY